MTPPVSSAVAAGGFDAALAAVDELVERLINTIPDTSVLAFDAELRVRLMGGGRWHDGTATGERPPARALSEVFPSEVVACVEPHYREVLRGEGRTFTIAFAGVVRWVSARPLRDAAGAVVGGIAFSWDGSSARLSEERYRLLAENATDVVTLHDAAGRFVYVSPSVEGLLGWKPPEMLGADPATYVHPDDCTEVAASFSSLRRSDGERTLTFRMRRRDGEFRLVEVSARIAESAEDGTRGDLQCSTRDITERRRAEDELAARLSQQSAVAELGRIALEAPGLQVIHDAACRLVAATLRVDLVFTLDHLQGLLMRVRSGVGWPEEFIGSTFEMRSFGGPTPGARYAEGTVVVDDLDSSSLRARPLRANGVRSTASVLIGNRERPLGLLGAHSRSLRTFSRHDLDFLSAIAHIIATATERASQDVRMRHDALHDSLTGLPNRTLLEERLRVAAEKARGTGRRLAVLILDIDHFKLVNDSLGHRAGDELLRAFSQSLRTALRPTDLVGRLGGDEFVVVLEELATEEDAERATARLLDELPRSVRVDGRDHLVSASVGVAILDADRVSDPEQLLGDADAAMYRAKSRGRGRYELFDDSFRASAVAEVGLIRSLRRALDGHEGRLWVAYQPFWNIPARTIAGFEALVRFDHPDHGTLAPGAFISLAEDHGLIGELGAHVLRTACRDIGAWQRQLELPGLRLTVNVSARQVHDSGLLDVVDHALEEAGLAPGTLALEITEGLLLDHTPTVAQTLKALRKREVGLVLDDFGTGHASLSYLQRFALDGLKVDRSFVAALGPAADGDASIVQAIVGMAQALGLQVIPEGIETEQQLARLGVMGCDLAQGFLLGCPQSADAARQLLAGQRG